MVDHPHGKHGVKHSRNRSRASRRQFLQGKGQRFKRRAGGVLGDGAVLHDMLEGLIDARHKPGAGPQHAPAVIAVAAANIQNSAVGQRRNLVLQTAPLQRRAPFPIYIDAKQLEGPLAPGDQPFQLPPEGLPLRRGAIRRPAYSHRVRVKDEQGRSQLRQAPEGVKPIRTIPMLGLSVKTRQLFVKPVGPGGHAAGR